MTIPEVGFLRLPQIIGQREVTPEEAAKNRQAAAAAKARGETPKRRPQNARPAIPGLIPVRQTQWWEGIREGRYPTPVRIGLRSVAWRVQDIRALIAKLAKDEGT